MTDLNAEVEGSNAQSPGPSSHVDIPLSTRQLDWVSEKAQSSNRSPASFIRLLIVQYRKFCGRPKGTDSASAAPSSSAESDGATQQSTNDASATNDTPGAAPPPSMFDYVEEEP
ncbi:hypothetical protein CRI93_12200 [Longimonas halophila]|uniref:Uncharacterized protein n=1 Tax=Longimonas halophila TaxID=1469170 RepID=A0A2H3NYG7_9BACT|nr:hypothetical protein [Longimonas halophila]PEN05667.1 hypothetical protein CRI93_12200 [Longimonas halophila]